MNFVSASNAYSLYGKETLEEFVSLYVRDGREVKPAKDKYARRGWTTFDGRISSLAVLSMGPFKPTLRTVGDSNTWIIKIPDARLPTLSCVERILREEVWVLGLETSGKAFMDTKA